jgi:hypothetical protein
VAAIREADPVGGSGVGEPAVTSGDVLDGARNLVRYVEIQPGQQVLIHTEPGFDDPVVVGAVREAVEEAGAHVSLLQTPHWDKQHEPAPPVFVHAVQGCDVLIGQGEYLHTKNRYLQEAIFERGLIYINNEAKTPEALGSAYGRFPAELLFAIGTAVMRRVGAGRSVRVTTAAGTDIRMQVRPETVGGYCYPFRRDTPGHKKGFPGGVACFHPEDPVEGVIAVETFGKRRGGPPLLDPPLRLVYRDHRVVSMEGDAADWLREHWRSRGDDNSSWLAECMWGIHPQAGGPGGRGAANPHLLHFGLGNSIPYGGPTFSRTWVVGFVQDATLTVDGEPLLVDGHLTVLDDPAIREVASRHGDPDGWLRQRRATLAENFGCGGENAG